jgi:hypothetical protein
MNGRLVPQSLEILKEREKRKEVEDEEDEEMF